MDSLVVTVFGQDRPGIIADVTAALGAGGGNLEDSTMTILRGRLAMMLVVATPTSAAEMEEALAPLVDTGLQVSVRSVPPAATTGAAVSAAYVLSVHGGDRPGIVSALTRLVSASGGNITDLTTRLSGGLYVLIAEVDLPAGADAAALSARLSRAATDLGVEVSLRPGESDLL